MMVKWEVNDIKGLSEKSGSSRVNSLSRQGLAVEGESSCEWWHDSRSQQQKSLFTE